LDENVVVKLEPVKGRNHTLNNKYCIYMKLSRGTEIPNIHWFGIEDSFYAMIVESLGPSLKDLFVHCHFKFMVKTVLLLAGQLVSYLIPICYYCNRLISAASSFVACSTSILTTTFTTISNLAILL